MSTFVANQLYNFNNVEHTYQTRNLQSDTALENRNVNASTKGKSADAKAANIPEEGKPADEGRLLQSDTALENRNVNASTKGNSAEAKAANKPEEGKPADEGRLLQSDIALERRSPKADTKGNSAEAKAAKADRAVHDVSDDEDSSDDDAVRRLSTAVASSCDLI